MPLPQPPQGNHISLQYASQSMHHIAPLAPNRAVKGSEWCNIARPRRSCNTRQRCAQGLSSVKEKRHAPQQCTDRSGAAVGYRPTAVGLPSVTRNPVPQDVRLSLRTKENKERPLPKGRPWLGGPRFPLSLTTRTERTAMGREHKGRGKADPTSVKDATAAPDPRGPRTSG